VRLIEENYNYSVIAKKLGRSKAWVSKWAKRWKMNLCKVTVGGDLLTKLL